MPDVYIPIEQGAFSFKVLGGTIVALTTLTWARLGLSVSDTVKETTDSSDYDAQTGLVWANYIKTKTDWSLEYEGPRKEEATSGALDPGQDVLWQLAKLGGSLGYGSMEVTFPNASKFTVPFTVNSPKPFGGAIDDAAPFTATLKICGIPVFA